MKILSELTLPPNSRHKRKRVGRGRGSGHGKTSGKGQKGQKSRSGVKIRPWFEGGQMPLVRKIPTRGFSNEMFKNEYKCFNIKDVVRITQKLNTNKFSPEILEQNKIIKKNEKIKILSDGEMIPGLEIIAHKFSKKAKIKIEEAGSKAIALEDEKNNKTESPSD